MSKIFSASILDLAVKKIIEFEPIDDKDVRMILKKDRMDQEVITLSEDERTVFEILDSAAGNDRTITSKELSKYSKVNYETIYLNLIKLKDMSKSYHEYQGNYSDNLKKIVSKWEAKAALYIIAEFGFVMMMGMNYNSFKFAPIAIGILFLSLLASSNAKKICVLSEKGREEASQWKGLKKYMEDYSLLKERLAPDIVLWEKYLVFATAFGVSKKLIKQLKVVHPEMFEQEYSNSSYWHIMSNPRYGEDCFANFSENLEKAYTSARSSYNIANSSDSDGGGGGGGFSSGGGGRRWRWKLRRTLS